MNKRVLLLMMAFIGGMALMSMELIYPKLSMIWFGNVLSVWSANLVMALFAIALGYFIGGRLVKNNVNMRNIVLLLYVLGGTFFLVMPYIQLGLFELFSPLNESIGSLLTALLFMLPTIALLAVISPILIHEYESHVDKEKSSTSHVFGVSTIAGVIALLFGGLYIIPFLGLTVLMQISGVILLLNAILTLISFRKQP